MIPIIPYCSWAEDKDPELCDILSSDKRSHNKKSDSPNKATNPNLQGVAPVDHPGEPRTRIRQSLFLVNSSQENIHLVHRIVTSCVTSLQLSPNVNSEEFNTVLYQTDFPLVDKSFHFLADF